MIVGKPGKEAGAPVGAVYKGKILNPNDMTVAVKQGRKKLDMFLTFRQIYEDLETAGKESSRVLEVCGALLVRNALMIDHALVGRRWLYRPPKDAVEFMERELHGVRGLPVLVYLQMLDAVALNEDVKYVHARNYSLRRGTGRPKNVLTAAHVASVILGRSLVSGLVGNLISGDRVAPLDGRTFVDSFPDLEP